MLELFFSAHCPGCPDALQVVRSFGRQRTDLLVVERNIDLDGERLLARMRRLIATPAVVIDGSAVLYGVPTPAGLERRLAALGPLSGADVVHLSQPRESPTMAAHNKVWYLEHFRMLDALSATDRHRVEQMTRMLEVRRGERIYLAGDPSDQVFLLKSGAVRITAAGADGQETLLAFLYPGDLFGELAIVDDAPRDHLATAHEDTVLCALNKEMVVQMVQQVPSLGYQITKLMGLRVRRFRTRVQELLCRSAPARIALTLLDLSEECGVRDDDGVLIKIRLNQGDLGNLVGLARETVNIVLQDFRQRGLIEIEGRRIRIKNELALRALA